MLAIPILKPMVILGALEMVQFLEGLFMDMEQRLRLEQLQATEREVIGKVIHNDNPKVISIHIDLQSPRLDFKYMKII